MPGSQPHDLPPAVAELARSLTLSDGSIAMQEEVYSRWRQRLSATPPDQRPLLAAGLLALANRLTREAGQRAAGAIAAIFALAAGLLGGARQAADLFKRGGLAASGSERLLREPVMGAGMADGLAPPRGRERR